MKQRIFIFLLLLITAWTASARDFEYEGIVYTVLDEEARTVDTKQGENSLNGGFSPGNKVEGQIILPSHPKDGEIKYTLLQIGDRSFAKNPNLYSVVLPESLTSIGSSAFYDCSSLTSILFPESLTSIGDWTFSYCSSLTSIQFPESLTSIGSYAFVDCTGLTSIQLPESLTSIEYYAFSGCTGIKEITYNAKSCSFGYNIWDGVKATKLILGENVKYINGGAFQSLTELDTLEYNCISADGHNIPSTIKNVSFGPKVSIIPDEIFRGCVNLTSLNFPESLTTIGWGAFSGCTGLSSVSFPESLTFLSREAFYGCIGLTTIKLPNSLTSIGETPPSWMVDELAPGAFQNCIGLASIEFPETLTNIEGFSFAGCTGLTSIDLPASLKSIGNEAFSGCTNLSSIHFPASLASIGYSAFKGCSSLTTIQLPESLTEIEYKTFSDCAGLTEIKLPESLKSIGYGAFQNCTTLPNIKLPTKLTSIESQVFSGCTSLTSVEIPSSLTSIGQKAFANCARLNMINFPEYLITIGDGAFKGCAHLSSIKFPKSLTSVGTEAFSGCIGIEDIIYNAIDCKFGKNIWDEVGATKLVVGEDVKSFGYIFNSLSKLETVVYNAVSANENYGFDNALFSHSVKQVLFGPKVKTIPIKAFNECVNITSLHLPESLTLIGGSAFEGCSGIKEIVYNAKDCKFESDSFKGVNATKLVLGENVEVINGYTPSSGNSSKESPFLQLTGLETVEYNIISSEPNKNRLFGLFPPSVKEVYFGPNVTVIPIYCFCNCSSLSKIHFPESLTQIGHSAFSGCSLSSVELPNLLTSIGEGAFAYNTDLTSIKFPESLTSISADAFSHCSSLTSIQFPESLTSISADAFSYCSSLTSIQFPASLNTIEAKAFYGCSALSSVELPNSLSTIYYEVFSGTNLKSIIIPESVTQIYFNAFAGIPTLEEVIFNANKCEYVKANSESDSNLVGAWGDTVKTFVVGENVESMDKVFISKLTNLETLELNSTRFIKNFNDLSVRNPLFSSTLSSVKLGNKITEIPAYTFTQCKNITSITFPESLTTIGTYAFNGCSGLTSLTIDKNISTTGYNAFAGCRGLENLYYNAPTINSSVFSSCNIHNIMIGENVSTIESGAFTYNCNVDSVEFNAIDCSNNSTSSSSIFPTSVSTVTFGEKVTKIPNNCFKECNNISSIDLPATMENIGDYAFSNCTGLSQFIIPERVSNIGKYAFEGCSEFTEISIPKNISALSEGSFSDCTGLTDISFSQDLKSIGDKAFSGCTGLTDLSLPVGLESVGEKAFYGCDGITSLVYNVEKCKWKNNNGLPSSIIDLTVGEKVKNVQTDKIFSNLTSLKTVDYRAVNAEEAENGYYYYNRCFPASVNTVNIGGNVETIPSQLFSGIEGLTTVSFESRSIPLYIGSGAFYYSSSISTVNVPTLADWLKLNFKSIESNPVNYSKKLLIGNENVRRITIPAGTASLGDYAFYNCEQLMTVTVPESLNQAGLEVFSNCTNLQQITFPSFSTYLGMSYENPQWDLTYKNNATIYIGSQELSEFMNQPDIVIPEGLTKIPPYAFYRSETLQSIDIPSTVVSIGEYAFGDCTNLNALNIPDSVEYLGENTFAGSGISNIKLPINMTEIPAGTFSNCSNLKSIILPASVNKIGERAFAGSAITNLTIPNGVTTLPSSLFSNCKGLEDVNIPNSVTDLGLGVFQNSGIQSISLPGHITEIPARSFYGCTNLSELKLPESVTNIGAYAFQGSGIKLINLPHELKSIGSDAFMGVTLDNLDIPDFKEWCEISFANIYANPISAAGRFTVYGDDVRSITVNGIYTNIRPYAFYNAKNLTRVRIYAPEIERQAFSNCSNVTALCIETDAVGPMAFSNMDSLKEIYCLTSTPPDATDDVFSNYNGVTLYVPQGSLSAYENSENCWWRFLNIVESDFAGIDQMFLSDVNTVITSVNEISSDGDESVEVFNLNGIKVADSKENLAPGLYIIVEKDRRYKIQIQ